MSVFITFTNIKLYKGNVIIKLKISLSKYDIMDSFIILEKLKKKPIDRNYYINRLRGKMEGKWKPE